MNMCTELLPNMEYLELSLEPSTELKLGKRVFPSRGRVVLEKCRMRNWERSLFKGPFLRASSACENIST